ncbi:MAG: hypothetical protein JNJ61_12795 [Anaerolineae bacterium]|nr:hypothetical protein [Anaerolineae bacterium]
MKINAANKKRRFRAAFLIRDDGLRQDAARKLNIRVVELAEIDADLRQDV